MGNDELPFVQELVGNAHAFIEQAAGILPKVEDQSLQIAHFIERIAELLLRSSH